MTRCRRTEMRENLLEDIGGMPLIPLTVQNLHEMIDAGVIPNGAPIELVEGVLVHKDRSAAGDGLLTHSPKHAAVIRRLVRCLATWCDDNGFTTSVQLPVVLNERSAPEPDISIITGVYEAGQNRHRDS